MMCIYWLNMYLLDIYHYVLNAFQSTELLELPSLQGLSRLGGGLSSFGFGGTNAHGALSCCSEAAEAYRQRLAQRLTAPCERLPMAVFERKAFPWREAPKAHGKGHGDGQVGFRFLRARVQEAVFEVMMRMDVYDVVKHHVVFGSIVAPWPQKHS